MARDESISVKDAIHKLQLCLLDGIKDESQLFAAGSLMSQNDYQDVVTERSIADMCGYPLCSNSLPSERPRKGRYRISLKEHKVYDLYETYKYCSTECVVDSRAFAGSLQEERCSVLNSAKLNEVLRLFDGLSLNSKGDMGRDGDLGLSKLKIQEKSGPVNGGVSMEEWVGPSNAIEGYVPQRDRRSKSSDSKNCKEGSKPSHSKSNKGETMIFNEMDFMSTIITQDEYSISKIPSEQTKAVSNSKSKNSKKKVNHKEIKDQCTALDSSLTHAQRGSKTKLHEPNGGETRAVAITELNISELSLGPCQSADNMNAMESEKEFQVGKAAETSSTMLKSSLKSSDATRVTRSVTWADEKTDSKCSKNLCEFSESKDKKEAVMEFGTTDMRDADNAFRYASAEACAIALSQAAEAAASGESDVPDPVSEAGIIVLALPNDVHDVCSAEDVDAIDPEPTSIKWPSKTGISESDFFDSEDSWFDSPPEGFSLTLSPFATMYMALFAWMSSSTLAYIYGRDDSFHEDYASANGREYPRKIVLTDARSSEIKQTLAGCLARALPGLVADLRLPTPISVLEHGMGCLLDTMSFLDPLPPFRMKQWQLVVLLFIDALSISRIPALTPHMNNRRRLFQKVFDGAQISAEEYEVMKDLVIPLGRVPQFSTQSGG